MASIAGTPEDEDKEREWIKGNFFPEREVDLLRILKRDNSGEPWWLAPCHHSVLGSLLENSYPPALCTHHAHIGVDDFL